MENKIVVIGGGGHAKVLISILKEINKYNILGYTDISSKGEILGVKYLGNDSVLKELAKNFAQIFAAIGVGQNNLSNIRSSIIKRILGYGYEFPVIISPNAIVHEDVTIKKGTMVFDGVVINSGTKIGEFCIINTNATIEHDCKINNFVHIAPGATLGGGVEIGECSFVGLGANIIQYKKIAANCLIGTGATVIKDCVKEGTYVGTPAERI